MLLRLWAALSGLDGPRKRALPIGELLHPVSLLCIAVMALNDHWFKGSGLLPSEVTGKLSDFTGLAFFPLLVTSLFDMVLLGASRLGARIDFSLRRWKLYAAIAMTTVFFAAIKLSPDAADIVAGWLTTTGWESKIVADPTDLIALSAFVVTLWIGHAEIKRVPLGRLEVLERSGVRTKKELEDALADIGKPRVAERLAAAIADFRTTSDPELLDKTLGEIRFGRGIDEHL